jgi:hypothetical protein
VGCHWIKTSGQVILATRNVCSGKMQQNLFEPIRRRLICFFVERMARSQNKIFGYPVDFVRFSWSTARVALKDRGAVTVEWPCDEEESAGADISSFFLGHGNTDAQKKKQKKRRRTDFYQTRKMKHITAKES